VGTSRSRCWAVDYPIRKREEKNSKELKIPLPPIVVGWFRELQPRACGNAWVLPGQNQREPISDSTLNMAVDRLAQNGAPRFTIHDLRRTARSLLGMLGVDIIIAEKCLNHTLGGLVDVYDRGDYLTERMEALEKLSRFLAACEEARILEDQRQAA
jgi:integrase